MEDLNLHFTGDIHAIGAANNLLAAMLDASILHGNPHKIDALRVGWRRALDMNDRALRQIALGLGGRANGYPRETGFDITAASEVMAILAVARDLHDLRARLGRDHRGALLRRRQAGHRRGPRRGRRDDRAAQGRAQAEPDPDARGPAVPDALRPVREHRPRQLLAGRRPDRAEARRLRGHRVGLRLGHGHGEVLRHRLPHRRPAPERGRAGRDRARAQAPRRRRGRPARRPRARRCAAIETGTANLHRHLGIVRSSACPAWSRSTAARATPTRRSSSSARSRSRAARSRPRSTTASPRAATARPTSPRRWPTPASSRRVPVRSTRTTTDPGQDRGGRHAGLRRHRRRLLPRRRAQDPPVHRRRPRQAPDLHGQDAPVAVRRPGAARTRRRTSRSRCATSAPTRARAGWCRCAATSSRCRGWARRPAALNVDIDADGRTVGLF